MNEGKHAGEDVVSPRHPSRSYTSSSNRRESGGDVGGVAETRRQSQSGAGTGSRGDISSRELDGYGGGYGEDDESRRGPSTERDRGSAAKGQEGRASSEMFPASEQLHPPPPYRGGGPFSKQTGAYRPVRSSPNKNDAVISLFDEEEKKKLFDNAKFSHSDCWGSSPVSGKNQTYDSRGASSSSFRSGKLSPFAKRLKSNTPVGARNRGSSGSNQQEGSRQRDGSSESAAKAPDGVSDVRNSSLPSQKQGVQEEQEETKKQTTSQERPEERSGNASGDAKATPTASSPPPRLIHIVSDNWGSY